MTTSASLKRHAIRPHWTALAVSIAVSFRSMKYIPLEKGRALPGMMGGCSRALWGQCAEVGDLIGKIALRAAAYDLIACDCRI
jgi:hypothetical protein